MYKTRSSLNPIALFLIMFLTFKITEANQEDLPTLQKLFFETILSVCSADYTEAQVNAWSSGAYNIKRWNDIITQQYVLVAKHENKIVGFVSLMHNYIDLLYVHKDFQRKGIAHKLYINVENKAQQEGHTKLIATVSITAKPFFEKMGYKIIKEQIAERQGVELTNYHMEKELMN